MMTDDQLRLSFVPMQKSQIYRWLLARAIERQVCKLRSYETRTGRRRWNFPTLERRRAGDV